MFSARQAASWTARGDPLVGTLVDARPAAVEAKVEREARVRMPLVLFDSDPLPEHLNCPWCRGELIVELFADCDLPGLAVSCTSRIFRELARRVAC